MLVWALVAVLVPCINAASVPPGDAGLPVKIQGGDLGFGDSLLWDPDQELTIGELKGLAHQESRSNEIFYCLLPAEIDEYKRQLVANVSAHFMKQMEKLREAALLTRSKSCLKEVDEVSESVSRKQQAAIREGEISVTVDITGYSKKSHSRKLVGKFLAVDGFQWKNIETSSFAEMDGRIAKRLLSTPGGDIGEFILVLNAFSKTSFDAPQWSLDQVTKLMKDWLLATKKGRFYMATDEAAVQHLLQTKAISKPSELTRPQGDQDALLAKLIEPTAIGSRHLRGLLEKPADYLVDKSLTELCIQAFYKLLWDRQDVHKLYKKMTLELYEGVAGQERAVVSVKTDPETLGKGLAPAVATYSEPDQDKLFAGIPHSLTPPPCPGDCSVNIAVRHPEAVKVLRKELVTFFIKDQHLPESLRQAILSTANHFADVQFRQWMKDNLKEMPSFNALIEDPQATEDAPELENKKAAKGHGEEAGQSAQDMVMVIPADPVALKKSQ